jgi:hypothetical protein
MKKLAILIGLLMLLAVGGCDKSTDNSCETFSSTSGHFDECTWTTEQADDLCESLGYDEFWGDLGDTTGCDGTISKYITRLTCCRQ